MIESVSELPARVAVIGGGTMGAGIAQVMAAAGVEVALIERSPADADRAVQNIRGGLDRLLSKGKLEGTAAEAIVARISPATDYAAASGAELVVEAVFEDADLKRDVARAITPLLSDSAIFASNTSSVSLTSIASRAARPGRVVGMHFFNPVPVMQLVEVVRAERSEESAIEAVVRIARGVGKTPVVVNDMPGFVANRILMPMINEAVFSLSEGVATKEAIDDVMKLGMAHPMGPLALADLIGLDVCLAILEVLHRDLGEDKYRPAPLLRRMVAAGKLGRKSGEGFYTYG